MKKHKKKKKITCTKSHRIYIKDIGWIEAINILENDIVLMYNNTQGKVINIDLQILDHYETTYNFEVVDNHNYYVSEECILVHNQCMKSNNKTDKTNIHGAPHGSDIHQQRINNKVLEMIESGQYSDIYLNRSLSTSNVLDNNLLRPDIIGKRVDKMFDIYEFVSKSQAGGKQLRILNDHIVLYKKLNNVKSVYLINW